ncbi:hypothetical protein [Paraburkholderia youngii]|uniref:Uncharacterized protein n=1 Tax=Paraburkholderia youngii TaxID=2782701 RepID=A0A7Y6N0T6_9BURK|nr:hypothetical protein [Paraburkholderia youngii]NUY01699.1 hypothetical protein [Paraburkholderia youngii]
MTERLNATQFAARAGCDEKQVRRALARGTLHRDVDGLLDAAQLATRWRSPNVRTRERLPLRAMNDELAAAALAKESALAALRRLEFEQRSAAVIAAIDVDRVMHELWREVQDSWRTWSAYAAPQLARELGIGDVERVARVLTHHVERKLDTMDEPEPDFLIEPTSNLRQALPRLRVTRDLA